jgi:FtsH-binding integral membrane protein
MFTAMRMQQSYAVSGTREDLAARSLLQKVYAWMAAGLGVTALTAFVVASSPTLAGLFLGTPLLWVCFGVELVMVFAFSAVVRRVSVPVALLFFLAYALVNGLTLSIVFLVYTGASVAGTFLATAGTFGAMSAFGYLTKMDLSRFGAYLIMGLWGLIIGSVVNLFFASSTLYWLLTYAGIFLFIGLTAYDTQKIKELALASGLSEEERQKGALHGALILYLDFINLFLLLLRLFGRRR